MLYQSPSLDLVFHALADPTRRLMLDRLTAGPATVSDLARPFAMSLPAVTQHLRVLESSGLVTSEKVGRVRTCRVEPAALRSAEQWISQRRTVWEHRFDRLGEDLAAHPDEPATQPRQAPTTSSPPTTWTSTAGASRSRSPRSSSGPRAAAPV